ncbi:MAG: thioredoxin-dependent thiol peroxidase [Deltaproteobacteria bacterium]|nr:MAG: thioredoxin-dependent thiol peroxidase [Deltaproteobacteria bacterium]
MAEKGIIEPGKKAPEFTLPDKDENPVSLKDFRGRWVVLYFYPKDNTPGCTTEALEFTELIDRFEESGAVVIGISPDSPKSHRNFCEKKGLKVTLLSDREKEVLQKYGVWQLKKMCGRESMGVVRTTYLIDPEGRIAHVWEKVKAKGHARQVLEELERLNKAA